MGESRMSSESSLTAQGFYERAVAAADAEGRLPVPDPAGMLQLRGSCLTLWEEMLPVLPAEDAAAVMAVAVGALAELGEARL